MTQARTARMAVRLQTESDGRAGDAHSQIGEAERKCFKCVISGLHKF